jgi:ureidoacrylate peracid hydrolase
LRLNDHRVGLNDPALLVLDMQGDFLTPQGGLPVWGGPAIVPRLAETVQLFRSLNRPVIFTQHLCLPGDKPPELQIARLIKHPETLLRSGCQGAEIVPALRPKPSDHVIVKYQYSAFYCTQLETLLRLLHVRQVIVTGVVTNVCCETTAHDAFFRNLGVVFALDGTGGLCEDSHLASVATIRQSYGQVATIDQIRQSLSKL